MKQKVHFELDKCIVIIKFVGYNPDHNILLRIFPSKIENKITPAVYCVFSEIVIRRPIQDKKQHTLLANILN